jgi:hypothetical protein
MSEEWISSTDKLPPQGIEVYVRRVADVHGKRHESNISIFCAVLRVDCPLPCWKILGLNNPMQNSVSALSGTEWKWKNAPRLMDSLIDYAGTLGYQLIDCGVYGLRKPDGISELDGSWAIWIAGLSNGNAQLCVSVNTEELIAFERDKTEVSTFEAGKLYIDSWHFKNLQFLQ